MSWKKLYDGFFLFFLSLSTPSRTSKPALRLVQSWRVSCHSSTNETSSLTSTTVFPASAEVGCLHLLITHLPTGKCRRMIIYMEITVNCEATSFRILKNKMFVVLICKFRILFCESSRAGVMWWAFHCHSSGIKLQ